MPFKETDPLLVCQSILIFSFCPSPLFPMSSACPFLHSSYSSLPPCRPFYLLRAPPFSYIPPTLFLPRPSIPSLFLFITVHFIAPSPPHLTPSLCNPYISSFRLLSFSLLLSRPSSFHPVQPFTKLAWEATGSYRDTLIVHIEELLIPPNCTYKQGTLV